MRMALKVCGAGILALLTWQLILANFVVKSTGFENDDVLGRIYKRGTYLQGTEGFSRTKINSFGMRGSEVSPKEPGEVRIVTFGDSFTEAFHVPDNKTYTNLLQTDLRAENNKVTVLNAGRSSASPAMYIQLSDFAKSTLGADFVVVQTNDGDYLDDMLNDKRNFYVEDVGQGNFRTAMNKDFASNNAIAQKYPQLTGLLEYSVFRVGAQKVENLLSDSPTASAAAEVKPDETLINWTLATLKQNFPNVVVVYLPTLNYMDIQQPPSDVERLVKKYATENGVPLIDMRDDFVEHYTEFKQPANGFDNTIPGTGHMNKIGHQLVADRLNAYFERRLQQ